MFSGFQVWSGGGNGRRLQDTWGFDRGLLRKRMKRKILK